jgi:hypothetical protein
VLTFRLRQCVIIAMKYPYTLTGRKIHPSLIFIRRIKSETLATAKYKVGNKRLRIFNTYPSTLFL